MELYLAHILQKKQYYIDRTMRVVKLLATGKGVCHPTTQMVFMAGHKVSLDEDFEDIWMEGKEWVEQNHGDSSKGWLIQLPLCKMKDYQLARMANDGPFSSPDVIKREIEDVTELTNSINPLQTTPLEIVSLVEKVRYLCYAQRRQYLLQWMMALEAFTLGPFEKSWRGALPPEAMKEFEYWKNRT
mmetsp:Transcript_36696/g.57634  ORF Transcript_36696/g.57634 Transcript_36696/m.57634 type:complete len:186 (-) Transcript_36696:42-599(-)